MDKLFLIYKLNTTKKLSMLIRWGSKFKLFPFKEQVIEDAVCCVIRL